MRMRSILVTVGVLVALVLTACGPDVPDEGEIDDHVPGELDLLRTKFGALTADPCHTRPTEQEPHTCERFVTQVGNTAGTMTESAQQGHPQLSESAERMASRVAVYRDNRCGSADAGAEQLCEDTLVELAEAVEQAQQQMERELP
ncbi:hypothetical protein [Haloechinothrix sp. LS1_15]|uniref:hypothetical protein n=1 Tax=Haloechinothrix sp. LS1_15 TaxID=2652248 RepID=UPI00294565D2|nr:hypothetical protein [Haloechinothrix sp. LS1_15]MDV6013906.1 hypothetical protein [Haloechinothrix sp. LS1_15]